MSFLQDSSGDFGLRKNKTLNLVPEDTFQIPALSLTNHNILHQSLDSFEAHFFSETEMINPTICFCYKLNQHKIFCSLFCHLQIQDNITN